MRRILLIVFVCLISISALVAQIDVGRVLTIGQNALFFNDYLVSIGYFNQAIELRPWMAEPYYYRALSKFMLGDYKGAEEDAGKAIERNAFIPKAYLIRGLSQRALDEEEQAIPNLSKALEVLPDDAEIAINLAVAQLNAKQYENAAKTLDALNKRHPRNATAFLIRGDLYLVQQDTLAAKEALRTSLSLDSTQAQGYATLALLAAQKGEYVEAKGLLDTAIIYAPNEKGLFINRGLVRYHSNDYVGAIADYTQAIELSPDDPVAYYNRALLRASLGDANNALSDIQKVLKQRPNDYMAIYNQGLLSLEIGDAKTALSSFNKVLSRYPSFQPGLLARAEAKRLSGDIVGSEKDQWEAYQQQKGKVKSSKQKSLLKNETRSEEEEAIEQYNQLIESNSVNISSTSSVLPQSLRGRIQHQEVTITPLDFFSLSYFAPIVKGGLTPRLYYSAFVEEYNTKNTLPKRLLVVPAVQSLDSLDMLFVQDELAVITAMTKVKASDFFRQGMAALLLLDLEQAEKAFTKAIDCDAQHALSYFIRANVRNRLLDLRQHTLLDEGVKKTFVPIDSRNALGGTKSALSPITNSNLLAYEAIRRDLDKVISLSPTFAYAYYNRAIIWDKIGQRQTALEDYNRAIELVPHPEFFFNRGLLLLSLGRKDEAIRDISRAGEGGIYQAYNIIKRTQQ